MSANLLGLAAVVGTNEGGKAGVKGPGRDANRVGDLQAYLFRDWKPADL
jgi:hypothetical protein